MFAFKILFTWTAERAMYVDYKFKRKEYVKVKHKTLIRI